MEGYDVKCNECGSMFHVHVTTMNVPSGKDKEEVNCPYCHANNGYRMINGFVYTFEIEE